MMKYYGQKDKCRKEKHILIILAVFIATIIFMPRTVWADTTDAGHETGPGFVETTEPGTIVAGPGTADVGPGAGTTAAGPGEDTTAVGPGVVGPGVVSPVQEELPDPSEIIGDIRNLEAEAPIVPMIDKYSYEQMIQDISNLSSVYGTLMQVNVIGKSLDNRDIYDVIIGNPDSDRHILIQAGIHGREHITSMLVMKQLELALYSYRKGSYNGRAISELLEQSAIHFIPMSNPDGIAISQFGMSAIRSEELRNGIQQCYESDKQKGFTKSGQEAYLTHWKANARGVDLNNNFNAGWELMNALPAPSSAGYKGTQPFTEPETQALQGLVSERNWAATISYHSMGQLIYWDFPVNHQRDSSRHLGNLVSAATGYRISSSPNSYAGFKDWMQCSENSAPSITLEVGKGTCPLPLSDFPSIWAQNKSVWAVALEFAM